jgi:pyruvate dehydrogenase E2 component (dihydrolipoamide acetyltransferase)
MSKQIIFPRLDQDMDEGILAAWVVTEGNQVQVGDAIAEIETAKVTASIESPTDGTVLALLANEGDSVPVGTVIAVIGKKGEEIADIPKPISLPGGPEIDGVLSTPGMLKTAHPSKESVPVSHRRISIPINRSAWTRPHSLSPKERFEQESPGFIHNHQRTADDPPRPEHQPREGFRSLPLNSVRRSTVKPREGFRSLPLNSVRRSTVKIVEASWQIPQFSVELEIAADPMMVILEKTREKYSDIALSITDFLAVAMARAIKYVPEINAWFEGDAIKYFNHVDLSLMVHTEKGLYAPMLKSIENASVTEVAIQRQRLVEAAKSGRLTSEELEPGTISLSNLGMYKIDRFNALLFPPQVAVLAIGRARTEAPTSTMSLTLTVDHRAVDGVMAARYLEQLDEQICNPKNFLI